MPTCPCRRHQPLEDVLRTVGLLNLKENSPFMYFCDTKCVEQFLEEAQFVCFEDKDCRVCLSVHREECVIGVSSDLTLC